MGRPAAETIFHQRFRSTILISLRVAGAEPALACAHGLTAIVVASASIRVQAGRTAGGSDAYREAPPRFHLAESGHHDTRRIRHLHAAGADYADGFQVLGSEDCTIAPDTRADSAARDQRRHSRFCFAHGSYAYDLRTGSGGSVSNLLPFFAETRFSAHHRCNAVLRLPGVQAPEFTGIFDPDLVVDDVDPHRSFGFAFEHDSIPAGKLHHGAKQAAEISPPEFAGRVCFRRQAGNACSSGTRHPGSGKRSVMKERTLRGS